MPNKLWLPRKQTNKQKKKKKKLTLGVGSQQIDDLDARLEDLSLDTHLHKLGRILVDGAALRRLHGATLVNRVTHNLNKKKKYMSGKEEPSMQQQTLMMRPRVALPTGMVMGLPVSRTAWPRTRP